MILLPDALHTVMDQTLVLLSSATTTATAAAAVKSVGTGFETNHFETNHFVNCSIC